MNTSRQVIMQVAQSTNTLGWHVEFTIDDDFAERLRQLRSLVPMVTGRLAQRDLVVDKVRARLRKAHWRPSDDTESPIDGSCIVFSSDGTFTCVAKLRATREQLRTYSASIAEVLAMHSDRPASETLYIGAGRVLSTAGLGTSLQLPFHQSGRSTA